MQQQVIIVGGGMVGLSLSLMLAKANIAVKLLEAVKYPNYDDQNVAPYHSSFDARNTALSRRSVQIYQKLGLWDALQQHATPILQVHITEQGSFGKARLVAEQEKVESFGQVIENAWLGRVLLTQVRQQPLIELIDGVQVTALTQDAEQVHIEAQRGDELLKLESKLLIAADGRDSFCRQAIGVGVDVHDYDQVAIVTTVQTSKPHENVGFERFSALGPLALLPLPGEYRRSVVWPVKKGTESEWLGDENDQHFLSALQQTYGDRAGKFEKTGKRFSYPLSQVLAHKQAVGRVILMGNAAHTIHPVAGQGFNLCLRDADVLLRYLVNQLSASDDIGNPDNLLAYEQARLSDQQRVIKFCDTVVRGFSNQNPLLKLIRNTGLIAFDVIPGVKPLVANYAMGLKA
ncbi:MULTISPECIES: 2-octaprenyl-6-methoxyphenyl hydroxylase [Acinetobacter]|jgi:2-octaprenyl-6-methoxyphenol hydroxylase (EC 1.14.13.-)/2-octaprenyl-3-methyl-6-methoxy-1,4-benzoquinol hydroxylase (EC 1.14.13.-)|uniref:2-octaprenyl-6-methoxyphenyl hydroxylase n=1 Tax=Acinetobacter baumannii TaxID=470 RepID=A0A0H4UH32_ACIBA|nr:2-octaprenyl-6-methoxyphenyl hydroxylase [Acinetobacter baumannii]HBX4478610.1 2-octaprenyl-6-methoxyphenyl hydroxylase [Klebsiella pneumoniae]ABO11472.2 ubiH protein 2-octaprenyl-6-methoxyphynol hydroxylase, FAD/NAD(P)-binding [Acinetobacter baumannii ATCC 17978]AGQ05870.1 2-polyprenyl-6-methoxyphenol hydroxylase-related FAD-dependent oxidoreductase [Acinetobacter baumannii BJAB0715]AIY37190.1 putative 2-polyprenyl-6-methoxyphenol 4-hydroxylase [Acinetobacter baumannii LAC-4]AKQ27662.1 ubi